MSEDSGINKPSKFDGTEEEYFPFITRFNAYAMMKQFAEYVDPDNSSTALPPSKVPDATGHSNDQKVAVKKNSMAMYTLTLCLISQKSFATIYKARTPEYPSGLAYLVVKHLRERYTPKD
jgi:hypothetical protein